ncbi:copper amine oxidase N-terminal domain-containing protein [Paenibacillus thiaminolyticus]|uniref:copper amine oxidase N-terminal domain-containing protein n=1 Tax=Paenibacillus thiaminolyticus TaxID=49283 RepID=UPI0035A680B7
MKRILSGLIAFALLFTFAIQAQVQAAPPISVYIDGVKLKTDQPPMMIRGRTMLPLRAIFEALDARVGWNQRAQTVTATKAGTTVVLKIGSKVATINDSNVTLEVPAQTIRGRTMVPVRFVSEAMGEQVLWNSRTQTVTINTTNRDEDDYPSDQVFQATNVNARVTGQAGNGSDLTVSFNRASQESNIDHYRVLVVKASDSSSFTLARARLVSDNNYTVVDTYGRNPSLSLNSWTRDVNGDVLRANQSYVVYVLTVGKRQDVMSRPSQTVTLTGDSAYAVTNVQARDVADYGDGRDMSVSFKKASDESNIANYRVMVVKSQDAHRFDLNAANAVSSSNYTTVYKSGTTLSTTLSSSSRDTSGDRIRNGVPYTVFVLSVSNNVNRHSNQLSASTATITLGTTVGAPVITSVADVSNYGDGRDLQVAFSKSSDESKVSNYRIFVVPNRDYTRFDLTEANKLSSSRYYQVSKTGYNITTTLSSSLTDVNGSYIRNNETYRVFVMAVSNDGYSSNNVLSGASSSITLSHNSIANAVTNVQVSDVSDYNDGRDMRITFNKASDESLIDHYRVMVVKTSNADRFNVSDANNVSSSYYTKVNKTGRDLSLTLSSSARDVDGSYIRNGVSYRVFVLSVGRGSYSNALSYASSTITLSSNSAVYAATNVQASDINDYGDGRDMRVTFTRAADESNISHYRVMVVKSSDAGRFTVGNANNVSSNNYTYVSRNGSNQSVTLSSSARDVDGSQIRNGVSYRVFVLSVGSGSYSNTLSSSSSTITLSNNSTVYPATNVMASDVNDYYDGRDMRVSFNRAADESNISHYRIMVVKSVDASRFDLYRANNVSSYNYTYVSKTGRNIDQILSSSAQDVDGAAIRNGVSYKVFVLSVSNNGNNANMLSVPSAEIMLTSNSSVSAASNVTANVPGNSGTARDIEVSFTAPSNDYGVLEYRVMAVKSDQSFGLADANNTSYYTNAAKQSGTIRLSLSENARDVRGEAITSGSAYRFYVLTVADSRVSSANALSDPSRDVVLSAQYVSPATNVWAEMIGSDMRVYFSKPGNERGVAHYAVMAVPSYRAGSFTLDEANWAGANSSKVVTASGEGVVTLKYDDKDAYGNQLVNGETYTIYVLTVSDGRVVNVLSTPSQGVVTQF